MLTIKTFVYKAKIIFFQLQQDIQMKQNEIQRESRKKDKMERELNNEKKEVDAKMGEIKSLQSQLQRCKDDNIRMEQQLKEQRVSLIGNLTKMVKSRPTFDASI